MNKMMLTGSYQGFLYQFIKRILLSITLVISSTNFHTCVSNITSLEGSMLHMSVSSSIDTQIQVRFSLSEAAKEVNLADYSLRISLSPAEAVNKGSMFQYYMGSAVYQEVHIQRQLLDFSSANGGVLAKNQDFAIPFQLVPGIGVKQIKVKFELLDSTGRVVSKSKLKWCNDSNSPSNSSALMLTEGVAEDSIATISPLDAMASVIQEVDTIQVSRYNGKGKHEKESTSQIVVSKDQAISEKQANQLAKGKEKEHSNSIERETTEKEPMAASEMVIPERYRQMPYKELAARANNNDEYAQELIVTCCLKINAPPLLINLIDPFSWVDIEEKAQKDERYVYLLLCSPASSKYQPLYKRLIGNVLVHVQSGNALAQNNLGYMYHQGLGVGKDYQEAVAWYTKAANQGHAGAQNNLGYMYQNGLGVEQDYQEAVSWCTKAANQGLAGAQNNLGYIYENGLGVEQDYQEAIAWYTKSVNQGHAAAQNTLGYTYQHGLLGVGKDYQEAIAWYTKAANQADAGAQYNLGYMYQHGLGVRKDYQEAIAWCTKAANQELAAAQNNLGNMYHQGLGVGKDYQEAIAWCTKAANQEYASAQYNLGYWYYSIKGYKEAISWFTKAANQGHAGAQNKLGYMYQHELGVKKDLSQAVCWFIKAKGKDNLLGIFQVNSPGYLTWLLNSFSLIPLQDVQKDQEDQKKIALIEAIGADLLSSWQVMIVQNKYRQDKNETTDLYCKVYEQLESTIVQLMSWRHKLITQPKLELGLMISCLSFKRQDDTLALEEGRQATGLTPFVKQHKLQGETYLSFGEENVQLADQICNELNNRHIYQNSQEMLSQLSSWYKGSYAAAIGKAADIESQLATPNLEESKQDQLLSELNDYRELATALENKINAVQEESSQLERYYSLLAEEIKRSQDKRNKVFQQEHAYLFK